MSVPVASNKQINPLLAAYLSNLAARPLLTKACTSGILSFISEIIAAKAAGFEPPKLSQKDTTGLPPLDALKRQHKAIKLALYGFFISAPANHVLVQIIQKVFAGKTSTRAKLLQILASNLTITPIMNILYISTMAIINGARDTTTVSKTLKASLFPVMRLSWMVSTASMAIAQRFLPPELWVPFFTLSAISAGTIVNVQAKKKLLAAQKKTAAKDDAEKKSMDSASSSSEKPSA